MADFIENELGIRPEIATGGGGVYEITVDGKMIFSKHESGRFPEDQEILDLLK